MTTPREKIPTALGSLLNDATAHAAGFLEELPELRLASTDTAEELHKVEGLIGAPPIGVLVGEERHVTIDRALRFLGLGTANLHTVPADAQRRMRADTLSAALAESSAPTIVCAQAGNVNTGAVDSLRAICDAAREVGAWVHIDGPSGCGLLPARLCGISSKE
jgi:glutamate/tyrosine decarboxylase-like PLP-dependent enzyme